MSEEIRDKSGAEGNDRDDKEKSEEKQVIDINDSDEAADDQQDGDSSESVDEDEGESEVDDGELESESERYIRLAAEFDNYKKRTAREFGDVVRMANNRILKSLVEIIDNFERAMNTDTDENNGDAYRKGVELIYNQLADLLTKEQVTAIESVGETFDPNYHEALMQAESDEYEEGIVCQEILKGYKIDEKVLRHAKVVVSRGKPDNKVENE